MYKRGIFLCFLTDTLFQSPEFTKTTLTTADSDLGDMTSTEKGTKKGTKNTFFMKSP